MREVFSRIPHEHLDGGQFAKGGGGLLLAASLPSQNGSDLARVEHEAGQRNE